MKLTYCDDAACRNLDCMHTGTGELKALCDMLKGGTGKVAAYDIARLPFLAAYEVYIKPLQGLEDLASAAGELSDWK